MCNACTVDNCSQQIYYKSEHYCYFHWKQAVGLIPLTDRKFYLKPSDLPWVGKTFKAKQVNAAERYGKLARFFVHKFTSSDIDQEALVQDILIKILVKAAKLDITKKQYQQDAWIKNLIKHAISDYKRANQNQDVVYTDERKVCDPACSLDPTIPITEYRKAFARDRTSIWKMTNVERKVWQLFILGDKLRTDVAVELKMNPKTITRIKDRVLKKFEYYCRERKGE